MPEPTIRDLTPRLQRVLTRAAKLAGENGDTSSMGVEHVFIAVLEDSDAVPTQFLARFVEPVRVRDEVLSFIQSGDHRRGTPTGMQGVMARAERVAGENGDTTWMGVEHVFIAVLEDPDAVPTQLLARFVEPDRVRGEILSFIESYRRGSN